MSRPENERLFGECDLRGRQGGVLPFLWSLDFHTLHSRYTCKCRSGFVDASANSNRYPGRACNKPAEKDQGGMMLNGTESMFTTEPCDVNNPRSCPVGQICKNGTFVCECPEGSFLFDDGTCRQSSACNSADCDRNAVCANVFDSYRCQCRPGYFDISPDPEVKPGRICRECTFGFTISVLKSGPKNRSEKFNF